MEDQYIQAYLTDADHVSKVFGCKNKALLEKLMHKMRFALEEIDDEFEDLISEQKNSKYVLLDMINGKQSYKDLRLAYIHVYEQICLAFGQQIYPPDEELSVEFLRGLKLPASAFMPIELSSRVPYVVSIANAELKVFDKKIADLATYEGADEDVIGQEREDYQYIIKKAIKEKKDLVFVVR
jgi:hypothetical protein